MTTYLFLSIIFFIISILTSSYKTKHIYNSLVNAFLIFLYLTITIMYFSADYFTGEGITQAVLFTLETGLQGAGFGEYIILIIISTFLFLLVVVLTYFYLRFIKHRMHPKTKRIKGITHNIFLLFAFLSHPFNLDLYSIYTSVHTKQSTDFDQYYKRPNLSTLQTKNYNLIYIYAESLEKTYFDESLFPGLMTNLTELKKTSIEFTNINQVVSTGWTIGGMTATQCGVPLFTTSQGNSMNGSDHFLSGATCLGDVLKPYGYHLTFMQGSSVDFSGMRKLYTTHKFDEVYGVKELETSVKDENYKNGWGLYDDTLFPVVYDKFEELSSHDAPFALFTATIDTHHPNGMTSASCSDIPYKEGDNTILNAVHCSDSLITQFIQKIQNSEYADKTLIVLTSDHLAMRNTATSLLSKGNRKDLFLIFDPVNKEYTPITSVGSMLDVGSTVLNKLGIKTDLGLGRNLISDKSLFSVFDNFNKKLLSWRQSVLKLWKFATLDKTYDVNTTSMNARIGGNTYKIPMLAKINEDRSITPFFEFDSPKKLNEYVAEFTSKQKFIWIDSCCKINKITDTELSESICIWQGSLSDSQLEVEMLSSNSSRTISTIRLLENHHYNSVNYYKNIKNLQTILSCKKVPSIKSLSSPVHLEEEQK